MIARRAAENFLAVALGLATATTRRRTQQRLNRLWQMPVRARTTKWLAAVFLEEFESGP